MMGLLGCCFGPGYKCHGRDWRNDVVRTRVNISLINDKQFSRWQVKWAHRTYAAMRLAGFRVKLIIACSFCVPLVEPRRHIRRHGLLQRWAHHQQTHRRHGDARGCRQLHVQRRRRLLRHQAGYGVAARCRRWDQHLMWN